MRFWSKVTALGGKVNTHHSKATSINQSLYHSALRRAQRQNHSPFHLKISGWIEIFSPDQQRQSNNHGLHTWALRIDGIMYVSASFVVVHMVIQLRQNCTPFAQRRSEYTHQKIHLQRYVPGSLNNLCHSRSQIMTSGIIGLVNGVHVGTVVGSDKLNFLQTMERVNRPVT